MKIGIDARALNVEGGSKTYAENILLNIKNNKKFTLFGVDKFKNFSCVGTSIKNNSIFRIFYENFILPSQVKKNNISLLHGLKGVVPYFGKFKKIATVHDVIPLIYPEQFNFKDLFYWKYLFPLALKRADKIIVSSKNNKKDITAHLGIPKNKIEVIPFGIDKEFKKINDKNILNKLKKKYLLDRKFIFYSGNLNPRKNLKRVIESFELIQDKFDFDLVITGGTMWKSKKELEAIDGNKRIKLLGFIPKKDLVGMYNLAEAYLYPTLYEGFGFPILEAQACGCPVITSNVSSMPEVAGKGAIFVDPYSVEEIKEAIEKIMNGKKLRENLLKEGYKNMKNFSWKKCAKETLKVYREVMNEK